MEDSSAGDKSNLPSSIHIKRGDRPYNDYEEQDLCYYATWSTLFPLQMGLNSSISTFKFRHLFLYYDNRFAHDLTFLFNSANVVMRSATNRGVSATVKAHPKAFTSYAALVNDTDFQQTLQKAVDNPKSKEARAVLQKISSIVNLSGKRVPYSFTERAGEITSFINLQRNHSTPSIFYSLSTDDVHDPIGIRWSHRFKGYEKFPDHACEDYSSFQQALRGGDMTSRYVGKFDMTENILQTLAAHNPIATALSYQYKKDKVWKYLYRVDPTSTVSSRLDSKKRGIFAVCVGVKDCLECNGRGSLHCHGHAYGGCTPAFIADVCSNERLREKTLDALDSIVQCELPLEYHAVSVLQRRLHHVGPRRDAAWETPPPSDAKKLRSHTDKVVMNRHYHRHQATCTKYKRGKIGCRMAARWPHNINKTRCVMLKNTMSVIKEHDEAEDDDETVEQVERGNDALSTHNLDDLSTDLAAVNLSSSSQSDHVDEQTKVLAPVEKSQVEEYVEPEQEEAEQNEAEDTLTVIDEHDETEDDDKTVDQKEGGNDVISTQNLDDLSTDLAAVNLSSSGQSNHVDEHSIELDLAPVDADHLVEEHDVTNDSTVDTPGLQCEHTQQATLGDGEDLHCTLCYAGGALSDPSLTVEERSERITAEDKLRSINYTAHLPEKEDITKHVDDRPLVIDLKRRCLPFTDDTSFLATLLRDNKALVFSPDDDGDKEAVTMLKSILSSKEAIGKLLEDDDFSTMQTAINKLLSTCSVVMEHLSEADMVVHTKNMKQVRSLVRELTSQKMRCQNGMIADYNSTLLACTLGNAMIIHLGAGSGSKATALYNCKYFTKTTTELSSSASVLAECAKYIQEFPSSAADSTQFERNAKHFAQRVLNTASCELEATQAAGVVLGIPSSKSSDVLAFCNLWDVLRLAKLAAVPGCNITSYDFTSCTSGGEGDDVIVAQLFSTSDSDTSDYDDTDEDSVVNLANSYDADDDVSDDPGNDADDLTGKKEENVRIHTHEHTHSHTQTRTCTHTHTHTHTFASFEIVDS